MRVGAGGANAETRTVSAVNRTANPNVLFTAPLSNAHPAGERVEGAALQTGVGFQPDYATEGKHEALEFAAGNYGLLESAFAYERDHKPPKVTMTGEKKSSAPIDTTFEFGEEPAVIRYTMDGSTPTASSPLWDSTGPREPGQVFHLTETTTFRWTATDIKGNVSHGTQKFKIDGS